MTDENSLQDRFAASLINGGSAAYLESLYEAYLADPQQVPQEWQRYFARLPVDGANNAPEVGRQEIREAFLALAKKRNTIQFTAPMPASVEHVRKQAHVSQLINAYRSHGHHHAKLDPLGSQRDQVADLNLQHHGFNQSDLATEFATNSFATPYGEVAKLSDIHQALEKTYCGSLGVEYMHITDPKQTTWLQQRLESCLSQPNFSMDEKNKILEQLIAAEGLEKYLGTKYVGQKRFSLEGGESLIPLLNDMVQRAGQKKVKELVVGMAHRGRLNVLVNVLGKPPQALFHEFEGKYLDESRTGDVKYHLGFSTDVKTEEGAMHLTLGFNPSHLEIISPVIEGSVRSRQERRGDETHQQVMPIIIHGDAAFAGQGVVMETFNMSQARGYRTGGTVHIIINNQIGFTTSNPLDARSTLYCTDVAKMVQAPILHVNGDDPEMVVFAARLALDFRMRFNKDVVIDLVCYRRHGHNESDEPAITQPMMYQTIRALPTTMALYAQQLESQGVIKAETLKQKMEYYRDELDAGNPVVDVLPELESNEFTVDWSKYLGQDWTAPADTGVDFAALQRIGQQINTLPADFHPQKQVGKEYEHRLKMISGDIEFNWGGAENLAYATLLSEGYAVRLSGQDCCRGTFSHRHAVLHDNETGQLYIPLHHLGNKAGKFTVIDSVLSEEAVLGFEYGYATAEPHTLVIWEAQFGDFANGAQVVIDQFISSGFQKWGRLCGLALFLPHGYEGMGPEHSSARLERFLQLCAQHNIQVCVPSTPAQCFHMIRRQMLRPFRKPLVVMTPKSLLRHKLATSTLSDLADGKFHLVIPEIDPIEHADVKRVVLCSGKVYYDLLEARRKQERHDVAIIRIEQLYPFPKQDLSHELKRYSHVKEVVWCQEEPMNQGAWYCSQHHLQACLQGEQILMFAGREATAAPAVGYASLHAKQQKALVQDALG